MVGVISIAAETTKRDIVLQAQAARTLSKKRCIPQESIKGQRVGNTYCKAF